MSALLRLACIGLLACTGCRCGSSEPGSEQGVLAPLASSLSASELLDRVTPYYPRWDPETESLERYIDRHRDTDEHAALKRVVARALDHDDDWQAFLRDLRAALPGYFVENAAPPWDTIPSYQVVIGYEHPPGSDRSKHLVFRLSHLAPVFDYHEIDRDSDDQRVGLRQTPTSEVAPIVRLVSHLIVKYFDHRHLDPRIGAMPVPDTQFGSLLPGEATLADMLFGESPTW